MKIVWLGQYQRKRIPFCHYYASLEEEMARIADVSFYGVNGGPYLPEFDVEKIVLKENPDVIVSFTSQYCDPQTGEYLDRYTFKNLEKIQLPKYLKCSDPHSPNFERHIRFIRDMKIDMASLVVWEEIVEKYKKEVSCKFVWMPTAIDINLFKDLDLERAMDVFFAGSLDAFYYPLRTQMLLGLRRTRDIKSNLRGFRTHLVSESQWNEELKKYIRELNEAKITPFSNSIYNYPVTRFFEGMACKCLVMAEKPLDADALHFIPGENFIEINQQDYLEKIRYYLQNEDERKQIAEKGWETIQKYHTIQIRAKQMYEYLRELIESKQTR